MSAVISTTTLDDISIAPPPEISNPSLHARAIRCMSQSQVRPIRTMRRWAEDEIVIPNGPFEGDSFSVVNQPVLGLLLDEIDSGRWVEKYATGPSQSAKTMTCFVIPIAYHLAEMGEDVVCGVPDMNMAADKWEDDLLPVFQASPALRRLLPTRGSGSDGGKVTDSITFLNGAKLKFMSRGAKDQGKAGFTARVVCVTEAAGFSVSVETSVESGPLDQLEARQRAWDYPQRSTHVEGTLTIPEQLPWIARADSSKSRIVSPCPHCGAWILPERRHLVGWLAAENPEQAAEMGHWICPSCDERITEEERRESMQDCRIIHGDQTIDRKGNISGDLPPTKRLFFHWQSWHNLFVSTGSIAREEWIASQMPDDSPEKEKAEKKLTQFVHGVCYSQSNIDFIDLDYKEVAGRKAAGSPRGFVPSDTEWVTVGVDVGKYQLYWFAIAFRPNGRMRCFDFGSADVPSDKMAIGLAIGGALQSLKDQFDAGWAVQGNQSGIDAKPRAPDAVWIDAGYQTDAVFAWIRSLGQHTPRARYMPIVGRGTGQLQRQYENPAKTSGRIIQVGDNWHMSKMPKHRAYEMVVNSDHYKEQVHFSLSLDKELPGAMDFFLASGRDLEVVARHLTNEKKVQEFQPGKGLVTKWMRTGQQHWLDGAAYARAAGSRLGWRPKAATSQANEAHPPG